MTPLVQDRKNFKENAIVNGLKGALSTVGLKELVDKGKIKVSVILVEPEQYLEVTIRYPKDLQVVVVGKPVGVAQRIDLAMSLGDEDRLQAIRKLTPSYGMAEGEVVATKRAWLPLKGTPNNSTDGVSCFKRNPEFPLLTGY